MNNYLLLIFDLDDTLFDYKATEKRAVRAACNALGIKYSDETYAKYKKANDYAKSRVPAYIDDLSTFRKVRADLFLSYMHIKPDIRDRFVNVYLEESTKGILNPEVEETLSELSNIKKVIGTNGSTYPRIDKVKNSPISKYIDEFYSSEYLGISKPNPGFFYRIAELSNIEIAQSLYIGDNWDIDIEGAISSGMDACYLNSSNKFSVEQIGDSKVFHINHMKQLIKVVGDL